MAAKEELEVAIGRFESYLKADPDNQLLLLELGELHHRLSDFVQALDCFRQALALSPGLPAARSAIARVLLSQQQFEAAERELKQLVDEGDRDPALLHNLGLAIFYQDRYEDALPCFDAAAKAGLGAPSNYAYLARCLHHAGQMDQALEAGRQWVAASSETPASIGYLALIEHDRGNRAEATELAARALAADPRNQDAALVVGTAAMEQQDPQAAAAHFSGVLDQNPQSGRAWLGLGIAQLYEQQPARGIDSLLKAQHLMPDSSGTIVALAWARLSQQDFSGAEQSFREAIAADRGFAEAHGGLASALVFQNRFDEARQAIKVADKLDRENFGSVYARSIMLKLEGRDERANRLVAGALDKPLEASGKPLIDYVRTFAERGSQRAPGGKPN